MSLYLKYRPQTFDDVIEQSHIKDVLKAQVTQNQSSNNYLFFGPRGTGKTSIARILAKAINCLNLKDGSPCNQCANCLAIIKNQSLDFVEIDAASHTQVDNIREEIIEKSPYPPASLKKKVYIIDEVHMLSKAAFNALLKIMEEPPVYLTFILATTEINKVPDTIASRCQVFNFKKLNNDYIVKRLKYICEAEGFKYDEDSLYLIAKVSDGALRDAIKYLDQVSILGEINSENVSRFLGVAPDFLIKQFIDTIKGGSIDQVFSQIDNLQESGIDLSIFTKEMLMYIDAHLQEDLSFYVRLGEYFREIIINLKNYPYPSMIYKVSFYKFFGGESTQSFQSPSPSNPLSPTTSSVISSPKVEKSELSSPVDQSTEKQSGSNSSDTVKEESPIQQINPENKVEVSTQLIYNYDELIQKVAEACDKVTLKPALKKYVNIETIEGDIVSLIVINQMQYSILTKDTNLHYITQLFTDCMGKPVKVYMKYVSKDDFLKEQLLF